MIKGHLQNSVTCKTYSEKLVVFLEAVASVDCTTRLRPTYCYKDDFCFYALFAKAYFLDDVTHAERFSFE